MTALILNNEEKEDEKLLNKRLWVHQAYTSFMTVKSEKYRPRVNLTLRSWRHHCLYRGMDTRRASVNHTIQILGKIFLTSSVEIRAGHGKFYVTDMCESTFNRFEMNVL